MSSKGSRASSGYQESKKASSIKSMGSTKGTLKSKTTDEQTTSQQPTAMSTRNTTIFNSSNKSASHHKKSPHSRSTASQASQAYSSQTPSAADSTQISSAPTFTKLMPDQSEYIVATGEMKNTFLFTLGERKSVHKPIKNSVYFAKLFFLCFQTFNLIYLGTVIYFMINFKENFDFRLLFYAEIGLSIMTIIFNIRILKSLYGIYAILFARSRRPLYLYLLYNYFVSCLYILFGLIILFTPYIKNRFEAAMSHHLLGLTSHYEKEAPTWYLVENVQHYGECCGYHSFIDFLKIYSSEQEVDDLRKESFDLPLTCCKNAIRGDTCNIYKKDLILKGCAKFLNKEVVNNINLPILILLSCDVFSLIFIVFLMRRFKDNLVKVEVKEDLEKYLDREEERFVKEISDSKVIRDFEKDKIKDKFRKCMKVELAITLRPTIEGLTLLTRRDKDHIELRALNPGLFRIENSNTYQYIEDQIRTGFNDLIEKQKDEEKKDLDKTMLPNKIKAQNTLMMAGGERLSESEAKKNLMEFGLERKVLPWQAVRTRNAINIINKKQDKLKSLKKHGLGPQMIRYNSLETRLDKLTIEKELRELKAKGEGNISNDIKSKIASSRIGMREEDKMNVRVLRQSDVNSSLIRRTKRSLTTQTKSDIIEDQEEEEDDWRDVSKRD